MGKIFIIINCLYFLSIKKIEKKGMLRIVSENHGLQDLIKYQNFKFFVFKNFSKYS